MKFQRHFTKKFSFSSDFVHHIYTKILGHTYYDVASALLFRYWKMNAELSLLLFFLWWKTRVLPEGQKKQSGGPRSHKIFILFYVCVVIRVKNICFSSVIFKLPGKNSWKKTASPKIELFFIFTVRRNFILYWGNCLLKKSAEQAFQSKFDAFMNILMWHLKF